MLGNPLLLGDDGYNISRSVRLRSSASAYFNRTPASAGNRKTWTWSGWVKRGNIATGQAIWFCGAGGSSDSNYFTMNFSSDTINITGYTSSWRVTNAVFRDTSAWYHIVVAVDTTNATANNRIRLYINGSEITSFSSLVNPTQNSDLAVNQAVSHTISSRTGYSSDSYLDGYITEINFIDGQALTPSSFGETDAVTGVWKPKKYVGTYGTNGFYLNFSDNSAATAAAIGKDWSGNGNNWTPNNISVTAGVTYDSMIDVPTMWADGGNGRGNYCVINANDTNGSAVSITNGNLTFNNSSTVGVRRGTLGFNSGKIYFEITQDSTVGASTPINYGIASLEGKSVHTNLTQAVLCYADNAGSKAFWRTTTAGIVQTVTPSSFTVNVGDVIQYAYDAATGYVWIGKNNSWYDGSGGTTGNPSTGANPTFSLPDTTQPMSPVFEHAGATYTASLNCGQRPYSYTPPTGFKALNTQNLPEATIKKGNAYFDVSTYTGNGSTQSIVNSGAMQPDFIWFKKRNAATHHALVDSVRGADKYLYSSLTIAEETQTTALSSFNANGFSFAGSFGNVNTSGDTYAAWQWKESVSAGFDIVTYTGTASSLTVNHSLGVAPAMIIAKSRGTAGTNWGVWHKNLTAASYYLLLNSTAAQATAANTIQSTPTSTSVSLGDSSIFNAASSMVMYLFAEVAGYSKFGSYTGNGSADGPFVYLGFRPRFILIKSSSAVQSWHMIDTARDTYNLAGQGLDANTSAAEYTPASSGYPMDILSNGFKIRYASEPNVSGATYIYAAFAENPFKNSLAR